MSKAEVTPSTSRNQLTQKQKQQSTSFVTARHLQFHRGALPLLLLKCVLSRAAPSRQRFRLHPKYARLCVDALVWKHRYSAQ